MAEGQVKIKMLGASTMVPTIATEKHTMFLSNLDLIWIPIINSHSVMFYKTNPDLDFNAVTDMLKSKIIVEDVSKSDGTNKQFSKKQCLKTSTPTPTRPSNDSDSDSETVMTRPTRFQ